jgi:TonB family protein
MRDGTVGEVNVIRSLDTTYGLDASAVFAAKQWRFNPGMKDGVPVAVRVTIEMTFTLR